MKPRKSRTAALSTQNANILKFDRTSNRINLIPRNTAQETYVEHLLNDELRVIFAVGPAGTR